MGAWARPFCRDARRSPRPGRPGRGGLRSRRDGRGPDRLRRPARRRRPRQARGHARAHRARHARCRWRASGRPRHRHARRRRPRCRADPAQCRAGNAARATAPPGKSDPGDAYMLAEIRRTHVIALPRCAVPRHRVSHGYRFDARTWSGDGLREQLMAGAACHVVADALRLRPSRHPWRPRAS